MVHSLRDGHLRRLVDEALNVADHRLSDRPPHDWGHRRGAPAVPAPRSAQKAVPGARGRSDRQRVGASHW